jgi:precorrin-6Y C5,15-methyltransferase (decarboxylating)
MEKQPKIFVISCGIETNNLCSQAKKIIKDADIVIGSPLLINNFIIPKDKSLIFSTKNIPKIKNILLENSKNLIAVLASGDSLFCGIGGWLSSFLNKNSFTILPNITAFQYLCSKLKLNWQELSMFSIHGKEINLPVFEILQKELAVIYGDNKRPANKIAKELIKHYPPAMKRMAVAASDLGTTNEIITHGTLEEISKNKATSLSILLLLPANNTIQKPPLQLGKVDSFYQHENNLITHSEVRAVILSKLCIRPGCIMLDLGAGSGSVGLEAAALSPSITVYSIEKKTERVKDIKANIQKLALNNINVLQGNILDTLHELPKADIIFIGGGGKDLKKITESAFKHLNSEGILVASAVTLESIAILNDILQGIEKEIVTVSINRSYKIASLTMMKSENPITIFKFIKNIN